MTFSRPDLAKLLKLFAIRIAPFLYANFFHTINFDDDYQAVCVEQNEPPVYQFLSPYDLRYP